jgi:hypothetical protein
MSLLFITGAIGFIGINLLRVLSFSVPEELVEK